MMTRLWLAAWITWAAWFTAWELTALFIHRPDLTLSDFLWRAEGHDWRHSIAWFAILAGWVWLGPHLLGRWWR